MLLPGLFYKGVFPHRHKAVAENKVCAARNLLPYLFQQRMGRGLQRLPPGEKCRYGARGGAAGTGQQALVQGTAGFKALFCALRLPLGVGAKQIAGIVAQKIRRHAGRALYGHGHLHHTGRQHHLFAARLLGQEGHYIQQGAVLGKLQPEGNLGLAPAGRRNAPLRQQNFIIARQCLQNHETTSQFRASSTPCCSLARKNSGFISHGSE